MRAERHEINAAALGYAATKPDGVSGKAWSDLQASGQAYQQAAQAFFDFGRKQWNAMQRDTAPLQAQIDDLVMQRQELWQKELAREDELLNKCVAELPQAP